MWARALGEAMWSVSQPLLHGGQTCQRIAAWLRHSVSWLKWLRRNVHLAQVESKKQRKSGTQLLPVFGAFSVCCGIAQVFLGIIQKISEASLTQMGLASCYDSEINRGGVWNLKRLALGALIILAKRVFPQTNP